MRQRMAPLAVRQEDLGRTEAREAVGRWGEQLAYLTLAERAQPGEGEGGGQSGGSQVRKGEGLDTGRAGTAR